MIFQIVINSAYMLYHMWQIFHSGIMSSIVVKSEPGPSQPINYTYVKHYMKEQYG